MDSDRLHSEDPSEADLPLVCLLSLIIFTLFSYCITHIEEIREECLFLHVMSSKVGMAKEFKVTG